MVFWGWLFFGLFWFQLSVGGSFFVFLLVVVFFGYGYVSSDSLTGGEKNDK